MKKNIIVLISGRGSNLKSIINATKSKNYPANISLVISDNSKALGLSVAKDNNITNSVIESKSFADIIDFENCLIEKINDYAPHLICLAR